MKKNKKQLSKLVTTLCVSVLAANSGAPLALAITNEVTKENETVIAEGSQAEMPAGSEVIEPPIFEEEVPTEELPEVTEELPDTTEDLIEEEQVQEALPTPAEENDIELNLEVSEDESALELPLTQTETEEVNEESSEEDTKKKQVKAPSVVELTSTNFPDSNFLAYLIRNVDTDGDGHLSSTEIASVITMNLNRANISDLTGIKYFTNLTKLYLSNNNLTTIDVSNMSNLSMIVYDYNPNLTSLDFRDCPSLVNAYHSVYNETVYISAGMINYIGCPNISSHTGNIVIDLQGFYTLNPDGSKSVDLSTIISPTLLAEFEKNTQANYDTSSHILTIPAGEVASQFQAGSGNLGAFTWIFNTDLGQVDSYVVKFDSQGGSIVDAQNVETGTPVNEPETIPTKPGYVFLGWFTDALGTTAVDFTTPIAEDVTYYAKWEERKINVVYDTQGGSSIAPEILTEGVTATEPENPFKPGHMFVGWYLDEGLTTPWVFSTIVSDFLGAGDSTLTLYAKWEEYFITPPKLAERFDVIFETNGGSLIPIQTVGEHMPATEPTAPTKKGFDFIGWYVDKELTSPWDFTRNVSEAFAPQPVNEVTPVSTLPVAQPVPVSMASSRAMMEEPEQLGVLEPEPLVSMVSQPPRFEEEPNQSLTLYAKWAPTQTKGSTTTNTTKGGKTTKKLPKTGEIMNNLMYQTGFIFVGLYLMSSYLRKKNDSNL